MASELGRLGGRPLREVLDTLTGAHYPIFVQVITAWCFIPMLRKYRVASPRERFSLSAKFSTVFRISIGTLQFRTAVSVDFFLRTLSPFVNCQIITEVASIYRLCTV